MQMPLSARVDTGTSMARDRMHSKASVPPGRGSSSSLNPGRTSRLSNLRSSIYSVLPKLPMTRPTGPILLLGLLGVALVGAVIFVIASGRSKEVVAWLKGAKKPATAMLPPPVESADLEPAPADPTPFRMLNRTDANIPWGTIHFPNSFFTRDDGRYDLMIHFHGNPELVLQEYDAANPDAVVAVVNMGMGSGLYEEKFTPPTAFADLLKKIQDVVVDHGLTNAHLRRVAIIGWSGGYGAVIRILEHPADVDRVDAVMLLDGLHTSWIPGTKEAGVPQLDPAKITSVIPFARRAVAGEKLFIIHHTDIDPGDYAGVRPTVDYMLKELGLERHKEEGITPYPTPHLPAMRNAYPADKLNPLERKSGAGAGRSIVHGYKGDQPEHHVAHLMQISTVFLPEMIELWNAKLEGN